MTSLHCHLRIILNLIKYKHAFVSMFFEFTLSLVILRYLLNSANFH